MVCLSALVEAIPERESKFFDCDNLSRVLRRSTYLLRYLNLGETFKSEELYLNKASITRISSIGFPKFVVDDLFDTKQVLKGDKNSHESLGNLLAIQEEQQASLLHRILQSEWFEEFLNKTLNQAYPMDRFTILASVWIIAVECKHNLLEQLVEELVDQIHHEEANSCNEEELMQLTQPGSFWLTHHRRYKATLSKSTCVEEQFEDGEDDDDDNEEDRSGGGNSTSSVNDSLEVADINGIVKDHVNITNDSRARLRKQIDLEILHGSACLICGRKPSQLLGPISVGSCSACTNRYHLQHCSLSYKPLPLFSLQFLKSFRPNLERLVLISPNEWTRYIIRARLDAGRKVSEAAPKERIDISETFEKLTVIRDSEPIEQNHTDNDDNSSESEDAYCKMLRKFAQKADNGGHLSESVQMIRFCGKQSTELPLCASDLLIMQSERLDERFLDLRLVGSESLPEVGSLWQCVARSGVSKLALGCGRLFSSLELLRSGKAKEDTLSYSFACPFCELQMSKVVSLNDNQDLLTT